MKGINQRVKMLASDFLGVLITSVSYIFVIVVFLLKFVVLYAGITVILAYIYSEMFSGNIEAVFTPFWLVFAAVLTFAYWTFDYMVAENI